MHCCCSHRRLTRTVAAALSEADQDQLQFGLQTACVEGASCWGRAACITRVADTGTSLAAAAFYQMAAYGQQIPDNLRGGGPAATGGRKGNYTPQASQACIA